VLKGRLSASRIWFQLALTGGFLGLLAWRVDIGDALATLPEANWFWVPAALVLFTFAKALHAARWRVFLGGHRNVPFLGLLGIFLVHNMANAVLLLRAGDVLRIQTTSQRYKIPRSELTATVIVVETLLDGLTFVLLVVVAFSLGSIPDALRVPFWTMAGLALFGLALGLLGARWVRPDWLMGAYPFRWFSSDIKASASTVIDRFLDGMRTLREPRLAVPAMVLSIGGWLLEACSYWIFGEAFGLSLDFADYLLVMIAANFAVSIPITPSGIGPYELAVQEVLVLLGVSSALAGGYAIGVHLSLIVWITLVGLVAMWAMRLSPGEIFYVMPPQEPDSSTQPEAP
jgi:glycosyltransferase 2 family protein